MHFHKPTLLKSMCLNDVACRYNGEVINEPFLKCLEPYVTFINVCPEVEIGLGIPREVIRLVLENDEIRLKEKNSGLDHTESMHELSNYYLQILSGVHGFIFKGKSPSCGVRDAKLYQSDKKGASSKKVNGLFSDTIISHFENFPVIDDGRLNDFNIREHFLQRIFMLAELDEIHSLEALHHFHHKHYLLILSYSQNALKTLRKIIGLSSDEQFDKTLKTYKTTLISATQRLANTRSKIDVFLHAFSQVSHHLNPEEKSFVLDILEHYHKGRLPFSSLTVLLKSYAVRYQEQELLNQSFFNPFPEELVQVRDSGKNII